MAVAVALTANSAIIVKISFRRWPIKQQLFHPARPKISCEVNLSHTNTGNRYTHTLNIIIIIIEHDRELRRATQQRWKKKKEQRRKTSSNSFNWSYMKEVNKRSQHVKPKCLTNMNAFQWKITSRFCSFGFGVVLNRSGCRTLAPKSTAPDLSLKSTERKMFWLVGWPLAMCIAGGRAQKLKEKKTERKTHTASTATQAE